MEETGPKGWHDGFNGHLSQSLGFPNGSGVKNLPASVGDTSSIAELGSPPGEGNGNLLHYSYLENSVDKGTWRATVLGVSKSRIRLSDCTHMHASESFGCWILSLKHRRTKIVSSEENNMTVLGLKEITSPTLWPADWHKLHADTLTHP